MLEQENEELEKLILALEEEKRMVESQVKELQRSRVNESVISRKTNRTKFSSLRSFTSSAVELQMILRQKETMIKDLENKYDVLKREVDSQIYGEDLIDFQSPKLLEEPRIYAEDTFNKSVFNHV